MTTTVYMKRLTGGIFHADFAEQAVDEARRLISRRWRAWPFGQQLGWRVLSTDRAVRKSTLFGGTTVTIDEVPTAVEVYLYSGRDPHAEEREEWA